MPSCGHGRVTIARLVIRARYWSFWPVENIMELTYNAQDIAAIWFMVVFCVPIFIWACKFVWFAGRNS